LRECLATAPKPELSCRSSSPARAALGKITHDQSQTDGESTRDLDDATKFAILGGNNWKHRWLFHGGRLTGAQWGQREFRN